MSIGQLLGIIAWAFFMPQREESLLEGMRKPDKGGEPEVQRIDGKKNTGGSHSVNLISSSETSLFFNQRDVQPLFLYSVARRSGKVKEQCNYATTDNNQIRPRG